MPTITLLARRQPLQAPHGLAEATCPTGRPGIQPQFHVTPCRVLFVNTRKSRTSHRALAVTIIGKRPPRPATGEPPLLPHSPRPPLRLVAERSFPAQSDRSSRRSRPCKLFRRCRKLATDKPNPHFVPPAGLHLAALWPRQVFLPPSTTWLTGALEVSLEWSVKWPRFAPSWHLVA